MFTRTFHPDNFLRSVYGTEPFLDYCRERHVAFEQTPSGAMRAEDARRWACALAELPHEAHARVELELAKVNELAGREANAHLLAADGPPPPTSVPGGAPLALWFFLRQPELFQEVFFHHEIREVDRWRIGQAAPGLAVPDLGRSAAAMGAAAREFFRLGAGAGRFCTADGHRLPEAICFAAQVADRLQFVDGFTDAGEPKTQRLRPALPLLFVYYPADGTVLLRSHLRAADRVADLMRCFGQAALGAPVAPVGGAFDLDKLKFPFRPTRDAEDMELVRVKALHLCYPERSGRRQLKLETLASDEPAAIDRLLAAHVDAQTLTDLRVSHAELQVRLRLAGRPKNYAIRLWPNRCSLNQTALGDRFRTCLRRWGLSHVGYCV